MTTRVCLGALALAAMLTACAPSLPERRPIERVKVLDQNWSADQAAWFHHASQGTSTLLVPYSWLIALEQPKLTFFEAPLLVAPGYLARFGFVASPKSESNPDGLPVGFAREPNYVDPTTGQTMDAVGFTCAACHTGEIEYHGTTMRVDGGPALTDLGKFRQALGVAVLYTKWIPGRYGRFAQRVLEDRGTPDAEAKLKQDFAAVANGVLRAKEAEEDITKRSIEEGFGRLDAINRIGNFVFGTELDATNLVPYTAPVAYPHIWDTPWFDWVQYNGSIRQPMTRNAGEALGLRAAVNLTGAPPDRFRSTVNVQNLYELEHLIGGKKPFAGLRAPRWPEDVLGPIDRARAARGATLYADRCQKCHLPPVDTAEMQETRPPNWSPPNEAGEQYLTLRMVDIDFLGTDSGQALGMRDRRVQTGPLGMGLADFGQALGHVVERTVARWYDDQVPPVSASDRIRMNGNRENVLRTEAKYKARPLDGVWATPPYLHNGSVPNLYLLLGPAGARPRTFYLGSHEYEPQHVGYDYAPLRGAFELDTGIPGNSNAGHEFKDGPQGKGVVGPALSEEERWDLIEYLKTL